MKKNHYLILLFLFIWSCNTKIKDTETEIVIEKGTEVVGDKNKLEAQENIFSEENAPFLGFWVGYFEDATKTNQTEKGIYVGEGFYWNRSNKINIAIDKITDTIVIGHTVVAGNNRPFEGTIKKGKFVVKEPGNDKYDGEFKFEILENKLTGKWSAYKDIDIKNRTFTLEKTHFSYNPDIMLEKVKQYVNWNTYTEEKVLEEINEGEFEDWIEKEFATATELIYKINASSTLLKKKEVENLKKGDITIIRNTIYARHGYSFKFRPLRVFFDAQSWYIPVHTNIRSDFTEIEKANIELLLRYEKNAVEYYDFFGRG